MKDKLSRHHQEVPSQQGINGLFSNFMLYNSSFIHQLLITFNIPAASRLSSRIGLWPQGCIDNGIHKLAQQVHGSYYFYNHSCFEPCWA